MTREPRFPPRNRVYRSRKDSIFLGICGGIAEHFDFSPWGVRLLFVALQFTIIPFMFLIYIAAAFIMRKSPERAFRDYEDEEFWNVYQASRASALRKVRRRFETLDKRLQRMESIVTDPAFGLEDQYRSL
jgi:phage shock protein C